MAQPIKPNPPLTEKELGQITIMAGHGTPLAQIALVLGITERTLYNRRKLDSRVQEAYDKGVAIAAFQVNKTLFEIAVNERNLSAIIWYQKTRMRLSERQEIHQVNENSQQQVVVYLPDNDRNPKTDTENAE